MCTRLLSPAVKHNQAAIPNPKMARRRAILHRMHLCRDANYVLYSSYEAGRQHAPALVVPWWCCLPMLLMRVLLQIEGLLVMLALSRRLPAVTLLGLRKF